MDDEPSAGFRRPRIEGSPEPDVRARAARFRASCPGRVITAAKPDGSRRDDYLGPIRGAWKAWSTDPEIRHTGSSGGTITALTDHLIGQGEIVAAVAAGQESPRRTVPVSITTREEALRAAGSRYAPVAAGGRSTEGVGAVVGKPCEVMGRRQLDTARGAASPILLSFFCAGTPSQEATDSLLEREGIGRSEEVEDLVYRGRGWPGDFSARTHDGRTVSVDYASSWGAALGPTVQWRCRLCADGVGESADVTAGDFWEADERGYPAFGDAAGVSALIARTDRGLRLVQDAVAAGRLHIEPMDIAALLGVQRYQVERRKYMLGRIVGNRLSGGHNPRYRGFGLVRLVRKSPVRVLHEIRGTIVRASKRRAL
ncbi:Coenzyme F420 hydrogenase/dehydrogenase, beta subunit C-terminal domain [Micrococcus luteus]|uniref:Coenzyme F420 hydrogenase/dehydrogenase, beta subunit C-terminal domain n=1 Tax=Micrococcus luteus TaxID=1270 RepID=UPI0030170AA1